MENLEKRMYFLVPYNISPIQQAIQAGHAALEYAHQYSDDPEYVDFIENWKTWIILNGGTTNSTLNSEENYPQGTLNQALYDIVEFNRNSETKIKYAVFHEPDLNDALTAICLVVDERVFNREDYPEFDDWLFSNGVWFLNNSDTYLVDEDRHLENYKEFLGGEKIYFLRKLLNTKKLA